MKPREFAKDLVNLGMEYQELEVKLNYAQQRCREKSEENKGNKKLIRKLIEILEKETDNTIHLILRNDYLENKFIEKEEYDNLVEILQSFKGNR